MMNLGTRVMVVFMVVFSSYLSSAFRIAGFNIQVFGQTKSGKPEVMAILANIIRRYDIIAIQEIRDSKGTAIVKLQDEVNSLSASLQYDLIVSERLGRTSSKEQYAFMFRKDVGIRVMSTVTFDDGVDDGTDAFEREPYLVHFNVQNTAINDYVIGVIHIKPDAAVEELIALKDVFTFAENHFQLNDVMILGDLNADCSYVTSKEWENITIKHDPAYHWLIGDDADTTVRESTNCAYDRFILKGDDFFSAVVEGSTKVFLYDAEYELNSSMALQVSDHYPTELELKTTTTTTTPTVPSTSGASTILPHHSTFLDFTISTNIPSTAVTGEPLQTTQETEVMTTSNKHTTTYSYISETAGRTTTELHVTSQMTTVLTDMTSGHGYVTSGMTTASTDRTSVNGYVTSGMTMASTDRTSSHGFESTSNPNMNTEKTSADWIDSTVSGGSKGFIYVTTDVFDRFYSTTADAANNLKSTCLAVISSIIICGFGLIFTVVLV